MQRQGGGAAAAVSRHFSRPSPALSANVKVTKSQNVTFAQSAGIRERNRGGFAAPTKGKTMEHETEFDIQLARFDKTMAELVKGLDEINADLQESIRLMKDIGLPI